MYSAEVRIGLKRGVADPEGANTAKALKLLGFDAVQSVHSQRLFVIDVDAPDEESARGEVERMCAKLLANPVIHEYRIDVRAPEAKGGGSES